jgi:hypothetical protein
MIKNNNIFTRRLEKFDTSTVRYEMRATLAITEDLILTALTKTTFFRYAALRGETAMRLFLGINRYYGQLAFSLINSAEKFLWEPYLCEITETMAGYGCVLEALKIRKKEYANEKDFAITVPVNCFLSFSWEQGYGWQKGMIKLSINSAPSDSEGVIIQKQRFQGVGEIKIFDFSTICAEKCQALLCRRYERGRDWYSLLRFAAKNIEPNYRYLTNALNRDGPWKGQAVKIDREWLATELTRRIDSLDFSKLRRNIGRFIETEDYDRVTGWTKKTFSELILSNIDS